MSAAIRTLIGQHARLRVSVDQLGETANLFEAGLDSLAMVNLMLAIEDKFGIELPESMLSRQTFASIAALQRAVERLQGAAV